ncbi:helix-hairpin-helix domain-containing protein [Hyunsoonleella sp. SJ7]|uniref:Helix-hairpin-helix domain-containing protein n=1 Tax=Hyunsoonleella aquatilis TaxID=2762758 RepID=A0A923KG39_9FLAO|nr:helix-hairpin-helix domain-containing protein [Hyunsoonleella aquatilis]MBC3757476.1 helix-hairpin-helix domain-containing protein [Hyunsoonleella aquatilis]
MRNLKSHFVFTREQRNGVFLLLFIIVVLQCIYFFVLPKTSETVEIDDAELKTYQAEIDSLRQVKIANSQPKIYPFNPNYITDYKGSVLGMSNEEIDRLLAFRKQNQWINSAKQFQEVTKVSDAWLDSISPYFKFPEWVTNPKPRSSFSNSYNNAPKTFAQKKDLNTATAQELQKVNGIGKVLSERIIKFRNSTKGGFIADVQLNDVYGLSPEVIENVTKHFTVKTPPKITKINLNTATVDELVTIQHIDYEIAHHIIEYRQLHEGFRSLDELSKVKGIPLSKIEIIKLSLSLD